MDEYIEIALLSALLVGVVSMISHPRFSPITSGALGILLLFSLLQPLFALIDGNGSFPIFKPLLPDGVTDVLEYSEGVYFEAMSDCIEESFGLSETDLKIKAEGFDIEKLKYKSISVTLVGGGYFTDRERVENFIIENFLGEGGRASVVYGT